MKILLVNKFHYLKGGSEKYYFELGQLLKEHGHEVAYFSMKDEKNIKTGDKEYFVEPIDLNNGSKLKALDVIYSRKNKKKMEEALDDFKPDIVHLNNFQRQLSASIIKPIKKRNIPIVFTAHDLQAICPAITMMDNNKKICELCNKGKYINCIKKKCNKGSTLKSIIGALEGFYYRFKKIYNKKIDCIITPSEFYKNKLIKDGIEKDKIYPLHNFIELNDYDLETEDDGYCLYFGRLSEEKGILNLINSFSKLENGILHIAGEGPEKEKIEKIIKENNLEDRIKILGYLNSNQIKEEIRKSKFVVVPSIWYENCPYSVMETLAIGKPVIGSNIGGIPELVKDNVSGFIYNYNDIDELTDKMRQLFNDNELVKKFSKNAKEDAIKLYGKEAYYEKVIKIYMGELMKIKNVILGDCQKEELIDIKKALEENTNYKFEIITNIANGRRNGKIDEIKRYIKYFWLSIKIFIKRKDYNYIIGWQQFNALIIAFFCSVFRVKKTNHIIVLNYVYKEKSGIIGKIYKQFMKVCSNNKYIDYIHVLGENVIEGAIKTFDIPTEKLIMTPFGINDIYDKYKGVKRPIKEKYILSIGRSNRDYDFLINSWNNINCELVIISDKYKKDKLPNNVKIIDTISGEEQYPYIMNAEAIILPIQNPKISSGETVLLGSMSFKKIVIVTKPSVIADTYIINKENGLIINKDEIEFENVINDILDNKYDYIKENARNSYLDNYSRYNMGKKLSQFIK